MKTPKNVDEYIAQAPDEAQEKLQELRAVIKAAAPEAEERISYGMPYYYYKGRLVYFQLWKNILVSMCQLPSLRSIKANFRAMKPPMQRSVSPCMKNCHSISSKNWLKRARKRTTKPDSLVEAIYPAKGLNSTLSSVSIANYWSLCLTASNVEYKP